MNISTLTIARLQALRNDPGSPVEHRLLAEIIACAPETTLESAGMIGASLLTTFRSADAAIVALKRGLIDVAAQRALV